MNHPFINSEAYQVEEKIPSMSYATLVENLGWMTELGVIAEESPTTMLVVARLVDRTRVLRSGLTVQQLRDATEQYRAGERWKPAHSVLKALESAAAHLIRVHPR